MDCCKGLSGKETALSIKDFCTKRIEKYGLHTIKSGACKSCPFRYRGDNPLYCCMFGNLPYDWSIESINECYGDKWYSRRCSLWEKEILLNFLWKF